MIAWIQVPPSQCILIFVRNYVTQLFLLNHSFINSLTLVLRTGGGVGLQQLLNSFHPGAQKRAAKWVKLHL